MDLYGFVAQPCAPVWPCLTLAIAMWPDRHRMTTQQQHRLLGAGRLLPHVAAMKAQLTSALPMHCPCVVSIEHCPSETWRNVEKHGLSGRIAMPSGQVAKLSESTNRRMSGYSGSVGKPWLCHDSAMTQVLERNATGPSGGPGSLLLFTESVYMCLLSFNLSFTHLSTFLVCEQKYKANERHAKHFCSMQMMEPMTDTLTFKHVLSKTASKTPIAYRIL